MELGLGHGDASAQRFVEALDVDPGEPVARAGLTAARKISAGLQPPSPESLRLSLASLVNANGVTLARRRQFAAAIDRYKSAMSLGVGPAVNARIAFNIGYAFYRWGRNRLALEWIARAAETAEESFQKPKIWLTRIGSAQNGEIVWEDDHFAEESLFPLLSRPVAAAAGA